MSDIIDEYNAPYFGFDLTHGDRLERYIIRRLASGDYDVFVQAGSRVTGYSTNITVKKEDVEGKTFEEMIAYFPLSYTLWDLLSNDGELKTFLGFKPESNTGKCPADMTCDGAPVDISLAEKTEKETIS